MDRNIAREIVILRGKFGWTQQQLAEKLNTTQRTVAEWEAGSIPRKARCVQLAKVFGLPDDYFLPSYNIDELQKDFLELLKEKSDSEQRKEAKNMVIIGLDFGNYNSFTSFISDFDRGTRMSGIVHDLLPGGLNEGIPSVYFYANRPNAGVRCGEDAMRSSARPAKNRLRYLKRHLGETVMLDDRQISYDEAITAVVQHCVRKANEVLKAGWQVTTPFVSLAYPVVYSFAERKWLIDLVEKATLEDGTHLKVVGTITEPAAAALDYLAEFAKTNKETTVFTYDLGGGTFDCALVSAYPAGRTNLDGKIYYYDILDRGGEKVGGTEFDEVLYNLLVSKLDIELNSKVKEKIRSKVEKAKIDLSSEKFAAVEFDYNDDDFYLEVTRDEFEQASKKLIEKTINEVRKTLNRHQSQQPEIILLTGGASQMPMVKKALEEALPQYKGRIEAYRPSKAISYGAARFGTDESRSVQQRVLYDLGVRFYKDINDVDGHISAYMIAGTEIPYTSPWKLSKTLAETQYSKFAVYESTVAEPDKNKVDEHYQEVMYVTLDHGRVVRKGKKSETRMIVDKMGMLTIEARDPENPSKPSIKNTVELKNLSR